MGHEKWDSPLLRGGGCKSEPFFTLKSPPRLVGAARRAVWWCFTRCRGGFTVKEIEMLMHSTWRRALQLALAAAALLALLGGVDGLQPEDRVSAFYQTSHGGVRSPASPPNKPITYAACSFARCHPLLCCISGGRHGWTSIFIKCPASKSPTHSCCKRRCHASLRRSRRCG